MTFSTITTIIKTIAAIVWLALLPIHAAVISVVALPLVDLALALISAKRLGKPITSSGLKRTVAKILVYETATILAFVVEHYLAGELIPIVKTVTGLVGMTELKSCLEHLDDLGANPLFASLLDKLAPPQPPEE
jgi:uncharacterized membrane protein YjgN (DUF898 family)